VVNLDDVESILSPCHDEPRKIRTKFSTDHLNNKRRSSAHAVRIEVQRLARTQAQKRGIIRGWGRVAQHNTLELSNVVLLFKLILLVLTRKASNNRDHDVGIACVRRYCRESLLMMTETKPAASGSEHPIDSSPADGSARNSISLTPC
jgi:hypothetical protein